MRFPGSSPTDHHDQAGVGVDNHLVVRRVAIVLRLLGDLVVAGGYQRPVHDQHSVLGKAPTQGQRQPGAEVVDDASAVDLDTPKNAASWRRGKLVCQYASISSTLSSGDSFHGRPRPGASPPPRRSCLINLPEARGLSPANGAIQDGSDAVITPATAEIIPRQDHLRDTVAIPTTESAERTGVSIG